MDIEEMHIMFRELAQQMGMQTTRAILSEDIDICLNVAIINKAKEIIASNVYSNKNNTAISPVNGLRTLYRRKSITFDASKIEGDGSEFSPYIYDITDDNIMLFTGFNITYDGTKVYPCRIVSHEVLEETLNDYCNRAAKDTPICTVFSTDNGLNISFYTGNSSSIPPKGAVYTYIKEPAKVYYDEDDSNKSVSCDLPEYLHVDIVQLAINTYLQSIGAFKSSDKNNN